jgi:Rrf2 family protein
VLYSRSAQYAIRALAVLAAEPPGQFVAIKQLSRIAGVPLPFLAKTMQALTRSGILCSRQGPGGGIALARSAGEVTLDDIVRVIDGDDPARGCVLGLARCSDRSPCPVHDVLEGDPRDVATPHAGALAR